MFLWLHFFSWHSHSPFDSIQPLFVLLFLGNTETPKDCDERSQGLCSIMCSTGWWKILSFSSPLADRESWNVISKRKSWTRKMYLDEVIFLHETLVLHHHPFLLVFRQFWYLDFLHHKRKREREYQFRLLAIRIVSCAVTVSSEHSVQFVADPSFVHDTLGQRSHRDVQFSIHFYDTWTQKGNKESKWMKQDSQDWMKHHDDHHECSRRKPVMNEIEAIQEKGSKETHPSHHKKNDSTTVYNILVWKTLFSLHPY
jgi:hypothetical protein